MQGISLSKIEISDLLKITTPFLFIDHVDCLIPGQSARSHLSLKKEDWFFECHLPSEQVMPGTLLAEAMLQTLVLTIYTLEGHHGKPSFVVEMQIKVLSKISPEMKLIIEAKLISYKRGVAKGEVMILAGNEQVCEGYFTYVSPHALPRPEDRVSVV